MDDTKFKAAMVEAIMEKIKGHKTEKTKKRKAADTSSGGDDDDEDDDDGPIWR